MNAADFRMCRLDGQQPTARERWKAFYRLWRAAYWRHKDHYVLLAFRVLMYDWRWIKLVEQPPGDTLECQRFLPLDIRWYRVGKPERFRALIGED